VRHKVGAKNALLVIAATVVLALVPAADAFGSGGRVLVYRITQASGYIKADFQGDQSAGCQDRGVCGYSGGVQYLFGGRPRSAEAFFLPDKRTGYVGGGNFRTTATTLAKVSIPGSDDCTDSVPHSADSFQFTRRAGKVTVSFHGAELDSGTDYLNTRCPGPGEVDLTAARALPAVAFPPKAFRARVFKILLFGQRPFTGGGFSGTATWRVEFSLQRSGSSRGVTTF
jgi:hypothetical protein